jgi:hypothetical protein
MSKIFSLQTLFQNILVLQISTMLSFVSCKQSIHRHIKNLLDEICNVCQYVVHKTYGIPPTTIVLWKQCVNLGQY